MTIESQQWLTYFLQSPEGGNIKIGKTQRTADRRLRDLLPCSPVELCVVGVIEGDREGELHDLFKVEHSHFEWYRNTDRLVKWIVENARSSFVENRPTRKQLKLSGEVLAGRRPQLNDQFWERVFVNDDILLDVPWMFDWNEGHDYQDTLEHAEQADDEIADDIEADDIENESPVDVVADMMELIVGEAFIEKVAINPESGLVAFLCGQCNSRRRYDLILGLADLALEMDGFTPFWAFVALYFDGGHHVGCDLHSLAIRELIKDRNQAACIDPATFIFNPDLLITGEFKVHRL